MGDETRYLIGADLGTTAVKVGLFDTSGRAVAVDTVEHTLITPATGVVEQSPDAYWEAFRTCLLRVLDAAGIDRTAILAMSLSVQGETLALLDEDGNPMGNFIVWMDTRAQAEAEQINEWFSADEILSHTGQGPIISLYPAAKILWLRRHRPDDFARTSKVALLEDWFFQRLVGRATGEPSLWCSSYMLDIQTGTWWPEMLERLGLDEGKLPPVLPSGTSLGQILPQVADELGLPRTLTLVQGGLDTACGTIGVGNVAPGTFSESTGALITVCTMADAPVFDPCGELACFSGVEPGRYLLNMGAKGGIMFRWLRDQAFADELAAEQAGGPVAYEVMDELAAGVAPGADGLVLLPHFEGAGAPDTNQYGKGLLYGLNLQHTRAHVARAFLEASAMNVRRMVDYTEAATGQRVEEVRCLGGASKSPLWCQIKADVLGRRVVTMQNTQDAAALGAAFLAGVGAGVWEGVEQAAEATGAGGIERTFEPDPANRAAYDKALERYNLLVGAIKPIAKELY
ncbi:MAG: hypothetical protein IJI88_06710 [Atopobiaceae bacterium]|nr:hypothetical protein [Atopobiaceae bacterium]